MMEVYLYTVGVFYKWTERRHGDLYDFYRYDRQCILDKWTAYNVKSTEDKTPLSIVLNLFINKIYYGRYESNDIAKQYYESVLKQILLLARRDNILHTDCIIEMYDRRDVIVNIIKTMDYMNFHIIGMLIISEGYYTLEYERIITQGQKLNCLASYALWRYEWTPNIDLWEFLMREGWDWYGCELINYAIFKFLNRITQWIPLDDIKLTRDECSSRAMDYAIESCSVILPDILAVVTHMNLGDLKKLWGVNYSPVVLISSAYYRRIYGDALGLAGESVEEFTESVVGMLRWKI